MLDITLTDESIGLSPHAEESLEAYTARYCVRVVVYNGDGKIALNKMRYEDHEEFYELPGGGIDEGEGELQAVNRETEEEVGCTIKNIQKIGTTKEIKGYNRKITYSGVYTSECDTLGKMHLADHEKGRMSQGVRVSIDEALELIQCISDKCVYPKGRFITMRDTSILQYVKNNMSLQ